MSDIEWIRNVTATGSFNLSAGDFSKAVSLPSTNPDEAVIRAINFNGQPDDLILYLVWCNRTNDFIGSFCGGALAPHFPQTRLWLSSPVPSILEFKLYTPTANGTVPVTSTSGDVSIHIDLIKYKRTPVHA